MLRALSVLSGVVFVVAFIPYIRAILRGETKPSKATWIIWATLDTITLAGMIVNHVVSGQIVGAILGAWFVVALALRYGKPGWTLLDKLCLGGAALAIFLWWLFNSPTVGMATSLSVVFLGSIPTFVNAWNKPWEENKLAWCLYWISCVFAVIAAPSWSVDDAAQPITFFTIESIMMFLLFVRPRFSTVA